MQGIQSISGLPVTDTRDAVGFLVRRFNELSLDPSRADQEGLKYSDFSPLANLDEHLPPMGVRSHLVRDEPRSLGTAVVCSKFRGFEHVRMTFVSILLKTNRRQ